MELKAKKDEILRLVQLGMDFYSSAIVASCTDKEIELLQDDELFSRAILFTQRSEEVALLREHKSARNIASDRGNTKPIEWMLEKLNPDRYGKMLVKESDKAIPKMVVLIGEYPDDDAAADATD